MSSVRSCPRPNPARTRRRSRTALALSVLLGVALVPLAVEPAHAEPECDRISHDYDGDGQPDVAVGAPGAAVGERAAAGLVEVRLTNSGRPRTVQVGAVDPRAGDRFGSAVAEVASNDENSEQLCTQLVVGAPGRDVAGAADAGTVYIFHYRAGGFEMVAELPQGQGGVPGTPQAGARFGSALSAELHNDYSQIRSPLYVGAPGSRVGSVAAAGVVVRLDLVPAVGGRPVVGTGLQLSQATPGVAGSPSTGARFGAALSGGGDRGVFVGAPGTAVAGQLGAGAVVWWRSTGDRSSFFHQGTAGVPGTPEAGDGFGTVLAGGTGRRDVTGPVRVGVPGEDVGSTVDAGAVLQVPYTLGDPTEPPVLDLAGARAWDQSSAGVAGVPERGDRFGAAIGFADFETLVGVPGEDVGADRDAGSVVTLGGSRSYTQDSPGIPGSNETGDQFGATIATQVGEVVDGAAPVVPLVGAPGEDERRGAVFLGLDPVSTRIVALNRRPGDVFGAAIGTVN